MLAVIRLDAMHRMRPAVRRPLLPSAATGRPCEAAVARTSGRARARGKPASPTRLSYERGSRAAGQFAANVLPIIRDIRAAGHTSLSAIAGQLRAHRFGVRVNHAGDYPARLRDARHRVELLYYQGAWELTETRSVVCMFASSLVRRSAAASKPRRS
jgi:hypothetical protein